MRVFAACLSVLVCSAGWARAEARAAERPRLEDLEGAIVLKVGVPTATSPEETRASPRYRRLLSRLNEWESARSAGLFVDVAFGSEYQVLEWIEDRKIDAALLSPFAAFQLDPTHTSGDAGDRDQPLDRFSYLREAAEEISLAIPSLIRARRREGSRWSIEAGGADLFAGFLEDVARAPSDPAHDGEPGTLLALPSHFSEGGFFAPLIAACGWLESGRAPGNTDRQEFWSRYFDRTRFLLGTPRPASDADEDLREWLGEQAGNPLEPQRAQLILEFGPSGATSPRDDEERGGSTWERYEIPSGGDRLAETGSPGLGHAGDILVFPESVGEQMVSAGLLGASAIATLSNHPRIAAYEKRLLRSPCLAQVLRAQFLAGGSSASRSPGFTVLELHRLIRLDVETSRRDAIALVLPGGGVKAAYQTIFIDHLYGNGYLTNVRDHNLRSGGRDKPGPHDLVVKLVTGNSGGALIGSFVAALAGREPPALSELLWVNDQGKPLESSDVFPFWDLPRWFTIIVAGFVLLLAVEIWAFCARRWSRRYKETLEAPLVVDKGRRWPDTLTWLAFLFAFPIGFKYVNGPFGTEHVPAAGGLVFFLAVCLAILGDSCSVIRKPGAGLSREPRRFTLPLLASLAVGLALMLIPVAVRYARPGWSVAGEESALKMPLASILFCAGIFPMLFAYIFWVLDRPWRYGKARLKSFMLPLGSLVFGCAIPVLAYLLLAAANLTGIIHISLLELAGAFWEVFLPLAVALAIVAVIFGTLCGGAGGWRHYIYDSMTYLVSRHPTRSMRIHRLARMMLIFVAAWSWWNLVVGPALYGNDLADAYICGSARRFVKEAGFGGSSPRAGEGEAGAEAECARSVDFQAAFVAPANSLDRNEERYFLYAPNLPPPLKSLVDLRGEDPDFGPQWRCPGRDRLYKVIFASGSPFPIFPAHRIDYGVDQCSDESGTSEWLVDGGFAHNIPIEAARIMGARQVLVLKSTPDPPPASASQGRAGEGPSAMAAAPHESLFGQLVKNLPRLVPFLYERAQAADVLSMEGLFVASISPSGDLGEWPVLFDFRAPVVARMKEEAQGDLRNRIGRIENWGVPVFQRVMHNAVILESPAGRR